MPIQLTCRRGHPQAAPPRLTSLDRLHEPGEERATIKSRLVSNPGLTPAGRFYAVAFSDDGQLLAGEVGASVHLWDLSKADP